MEKKLKLTKEEQEQQMVDMKLFGLLFPLFDSMSKRGKETTIDTLIMYLLMEDEIC